MDSDRSGWSRYADLIRKCFPSRLRCLPLREANAPVALRTPAARHSPHPHTHIHTPLFNLPPPHPHCRPPLPTPSPPSIRGGARITVTCLHPPAGHTKERGEVWTRGIGTGRKVEIQRDEKQDVCYTLTVHVQTPVLHIDKHMSIASLGGFCGQANTPLHCGTR